MAPPERLILIFNIGRCGTTLLNAMLNEIDGVMDADDVHPEELLAPIWAFDLEEYLRQFGSGLPFLAIRYNELNADRTGVVARFLRHCGLPDEALAQAARAFERDSQEGTAIARDHRADSYTDENAARFLATLERHPWIRSPDYLVPDIYGPGTAS